MLKMYDKLVVAVLERDVTHHRILKMYKKGVACKQGQQRIVKDLRRDLS